MIKNWMTSKRLVIAPEKSEATLLVGRKEYNSFKIQMGNVVILQKDHLKYLDIILDSKVSFLPHIKYVAAKAEKLTTSLMRITPRLGGAGENKRRVLQRCTESILLYDITFWRRRIVGRIGGREVVDTTEGLIALVKSEEGRRLQTSGLRKKEVWCKLPEKFKALFGIDIPGADRTARGKKMNEKYNNLNRMVMRHKKHVNRSGAPMKKAPKYFDFIEEESSDLHHMNPTFQVQELHNYLDCP
ncbi:hypothetical protein M8J77_006553 [Diaphorina citri]|nr:hypothetical protein M8J77_006553 [Diaphorina citri]